MRHWQSRDRKREAKRRKMKFSGAGLRTNVRDAQLKRYEEVMNGSIRQ